MTAIAQNIVCAPLFRAVPLPVFGALIAPPLAGGVATGAGAGTTVGFGAGSGASAEKFGICQISPGPKASTASFTMYAVSPLNTSEVAN